MYILDRTEFDAYDPIERKLYKTSEQELFDKHIMDDNRKLRVSVEYTTYDKNGNPTKVKTYNQDVITSMSIDLEAINGSSFAFGCMGSKTLNLGTTFEFDRVKGDHIRPYIELRAQIFDVHKDLKELWLKVPLGVFVIDEVTNNHLTKDIVAYDYSCFLDTGDIYKFPNYIYKEVKEEQELQENMNVLEDMINYINTSDDFIDVRMNLGYLDDDGKIIKDIINVEKLGIDKTVRFDNLGENFTLRGFIGYLAGLQGKNAMFDRFGELVFVEFNGTPISSIYNEDFILTLKEDEIDVVVEKLTAQYVELELDPIQETPVTPPEGEPEAQDETSTEQPKQEEKRNGSWVTKTVSYPEAPSFYEYTFFNPLVNEKNSTLDDIHAAVTKGNASYSYTPCKCKIKGDPRIDMNEVITLNRRKKIYNDGKWMTIYDPKGEEHTEYHLQVPIMKMKMYLNAGCILEIESLHESKQTATSTLSGSLSSKIDNVTAMAKGMFNDIYGVNATIGNLTAKNARINKIVADYIKTDIVVGEDAILNSAIVGKIDANEIEVVNLNADEIKTGKLKADFIEGGTLNAEKMDVINLNAKSITSGVLNVSDGLSIMSYSPDEEHGGTMKIGGNAISMTDKDGITRVYIGEKQTIEGEEVTHDFNFILRGPATEENPNGVVLWNAKGLAPEAIPPGFIQNDMIGKEDKITADKIDINTVIGGINDGKNNSIISDKIEVTEEGKAPADLTTTIGNLRIAISDSKTETDGSITEMNSSINQRIDGIELSVVKTNKKIDEDITGKIESNTALIKSTADNVLIEVDKKDKVLEDGLVKKIDANTALIDTTATAIRGEVSSTVKDLNGRIDLNKTTIEATANSFESTVFETKLDENGNEVKVSKIQQNADKIELKVNNDGVIAAINMSTEKENGSTVKISADKVEVDGKLVVDAINGSSTVINGDHIKTGSITLDHLTVEAKNELESTEVSKEDVFNALTNNGEWKGIYAGTDGNMYMNADYIKSGVIKADMIEVNVSSKNLLPHAYVALNSHINEDAYVMMDYFLDDEKNHIPAIELKTPNTLDVEEYKRKYIVKQLSDVPITLEEGHWYYFTVDVLANWTNDTRLSLMHPEDPFDFNIKYPISPKGNGVTGSFGTANGSSLTMFLANGEDDFSNGNGNYIELMEIPDFDSGIDIEMYSSDMTRGADGQILRKLTTKKFATRLIPQGGFTGSLWYEMDFLSPVEGLIVYISGMQLFDSKEFNSIQDVTPFNYYKEIREKCIELSDNKFYKGNYSVDGISLQEGTVQGNSESTKYKYRIDYNGLQHGSQSSQYNKDEFMQVGLNNRLWRANYDEWNPITGGLETVAGHYCHGYGMLAELKDGYDTRKGIFCGIHGEYEDPQDNGSLGRPDIYVLDFLNNYDHNWKLIGEEIIPNGLVRRDNDMNIVTQNQLMFNDESALVNIASEPYDLGSLFGVASTATINDDEGNPVQIKQSPLITEVQQLKQENEDLKRRIEALEEIIKNMQ